MRAARRRTPAQDRDGEGRRPHLWRDFVRASVGLHVGALLILVCLRNLGWDTRVMLGRIETAEGVVSRSVPGDILSGRGGSMQLYETDITFTDASGKARGFRTHWGQAYPRQSRVAVEYARGYPWLERIQNTSDLGATAGSWLTLATGVGWPMFFLHLPLCFVFLRGLVGGRRVPENQPEPWAIARYATGTVSLVGIEVSLAWYLYVW